MIPMTVRLDMPGENTGMTSLLVVVRRAICTPLTAANNIQGDMIRSCEATVPCSPPSRPGDANLTMVFDAAKVTRLSAHATMLVTVTRQSAVLRFVVIFEPPSSTL